jgi:hypothetical protein
MPNATRLETMTQCTFKKVTEPLTTTVAWIESKSAKVGYKVTFREDKQTWWEVVSTGAVLPMDKALENSKDWERTREASDI